MMQRLSTRVAVQRSLRREHDGLIADLQAFKRARMVGANPLPDPASSCDLCATPIPERCLAVLDCRPFHIACANRVLRDEMAALGRFFRDNGLYTFVRWHTFFTNPPLTITESQLDEGLSVIDKALDITDRAVKD